MIIFSPYHYDILLSDKNAEKDKNIAIYNPDLTREVLVKQILTYVPRLNENVCILRHFRSRQVSRSSGGGFDKIVNPLVAIPAAPGSGKSTFLANFPDSDEFKLYCRDCGDASPAIVAPLTFNSGMTTPFVSVGSSIIEHSFGLRILFGAAMVMRQPGQAPSLPTKSGFPDWKSFCVEFEDYHHVSGVQAISILRHIFGEDRRVLVLVDELAKIEGDGSDKLVARQIGAILDDSGLNEVLVSSLSPQYINTLLSGNDRQIKCIIFESLIESDLGREQTKVWADKLLEEHCSAPDRTVDIFAKTFLQSIFLLCSGHPRSVQYLVESFGSDTCWFRTIAVLKEYGVDVTLPQLLSSVNMDFLEFVNPVRDIIVKQIDPSDENVSNLERVLKLNFLDEDVIYRRELENGAVYILPSTLYSRGQYRATISLVAFFKLIMCQQQETQSTAYRRVCRCTIRGL